MDKHAKNYFSSCRLRTSHNTAVAAHRLGTNEVIVLEFLYLSINYFSSVQFSHSVMLDSATPWTTALQTSLSITKSQSPLKPMSVESVMPSNHLILCRPLLLLPSIFSSTRVFSSESALCIRWPKYWSFSFSNSPSIEYSGLIFFRMDWLDLLAVQWTLKSLLQHHSSKASILQCSPFFIVQLSHPYTTTGKTIALTRGTFVGKVMCLLYLICCLLAASDVLGTVGKYRQEVILTFRRTHVGQCQAAWGGACAGVLLPALSSFVTLGKLVHLFVCQFSHPWSRDKISSLLHWTVRLSWWLRW